MKLSIIIPSYNQQRYISDSITSALRQTVPCEIIVVDDGSTDDSIWIAKSYEDSGVKVISQVNKGLSSARNTGIMNATGDFVLPLDADDILLPNAVERILEVAEQTNADVIGPSFKEFGVRDREVILNGVPTIEDFKTANRLGYFSAIRRSVLLAIGGYNPKMALGYEDWDCWIDIFKRGYSLAIIPEILVYYRTKETSMLSNSDKHREELIEQMRKNHPTVYA